MRCLFVVGFVISLSINICKIWIQLQYKFTCMTFVFINNAALRSRTKNSFEEENYNCPPTDYYYALSWETTEPAVSSRYGGRRNQQPIVPCGRTLSQTVLGWHWRGSQRLSGLASRHQRRLSHALSGCCQWIEHCHVRNQKNEYSFGEPRLHMAVHTGGRENSAAWRWFSSGKWPVGWPAKQTFGKRYVICKFDAKAVQPNVTRHSPRHVGRSVLTFTWTVPHDHPSWIFKQVYPAWRGTFHPNIRSTSAR